MSETVHRPESNSPWRIATLILLGLLAATDSKLHAAPGTGIDARMNPIPSNPAVPGGSGPARDGPQRGAAAPDLTAESLPKPTAAQQAWQDAELGVLISLDQRIYDDAPKAENLDCRVPMKDPAAYANRFNPAKLDTDQWLASVKAMGATFAVLVVKHETGFCMWQSDANPYSLKHIAWRDGRADILRDFVASCRNAGIKPGIFTEARHDLRLGVSSYRMSDLSPMTKHDYNHLIEREVEELCSRYGQLFEIWFDGGAQSPDQGGPDLVPIVAKHQPQILFYHSDQRREVRWGGTETGTVAYPCWATVDLGKIQTGTYNPGYLSHGDPNGHDWCPAMSDIPLRCQNARHDWYWHPGGERGVASLASLQTMYYNSVGRNSTLIVGLTPDRDGLLPDPDVARCKEFGSWLGQTFAAKPLAEVSAKGSVCSLEIPASVATPVTHLMLREDIKDGERVRNYAIDAELDGAWQQLAAGTCIGHLHIERIPPCTARKFRLRITQAIGLPAIRSFSVR